jgi:phage antirepressor YoqD-like protein
MNDTSDTKRLADAVSNVATTIAEIIELKLRELTETAKPAQPACSPLDRLPPAEGWVGKTEMAEHFKISKRTLYGWMQKRSIPYVELSRCAAGG